MTQEAGQEILTSIAIGRVEKTSDSLKRQDAKDYLLELYHSKRHSDNKFDFQTALNREMEKLEYGHKAN